VVFCVGGSLRFIYDLRRAKAESETTLPFLLKGKKPFTRFRQPFRFLSKRIWK